jgi:MinD-like ATPase involved in chromosome partitioning or flagellar assembly
MNFLRKTIAAIVGKGGGGKTMFFSNICLQAALYLKETYNSALSITGLDYDAIHSFYYDLPNMRLNITNFTSDLEEFKNYKYDIFKIIEKERQNNYILINFPGDNTLDMMMELINYINEVIVVTHQEESAHNINSQLIPDIFKYLEQRKIYDKNLERIFMLYSQVGHKYAEDQFRFPGKRMVDKKLFATYEERIQRAFAENKINKSLKIQGIHWFDKITSESAGQNDLQIIPLYHIERSPLIARSKIRNKPLIIDYMPFTKKQIQEIPEFSNNIDKFFELSDDEEEKKKEIFYALPNIEQLIGNQGFSGERVSFLNDYLQKYCYLYREDLENLPLPIRAIKENAKYLIENVFKPGK